MRGLEAAFIAMLCVFLGLLSVGCSCGDDDDDDSGSPPDDDVDDDMDDDADDDVDETIFEIDFEAYSNGVLPSDWLVTEYGVSTVEVGDIPTKDGSGKGMHQVGGSLPGISSFVLATRTFPETDEDMWLTFEVWVEDNDVDAGFRVMQDYGGYPLTETQLLINDGVLKALDYSDFTYVECGNMPAADWTELAFFVDFDGGTYDVDLDGADTDCEGLPLAMGDGNPLAYFQVIDWSDNGYGGTFYVDNLVGEDGSMSNIFTEDFNSYSTGALVDPWDASFIGGDTTATISTLVSKDGSGKALKIVGDGGQIPDYSTALYQFPDVAANLWVQFDVNVVDSDAEFGFQGLANYLDYPLAESTVLVANEMLRAMNGGIFDYEDCAAFSTGVWHTVGVYHDFQAGTYDVELDGAATNCTGLPYIFNFGMPFAYVQFLDWSDEDYDGEVWYDNIVGIIPAS
jgi:hypothetical protein